MLLLFAKTCTNIIEIAIPISGENSMVGSIIL